MLYITEEVIRTTAKSHLLVEGEGCLIKSGNGEDVKLPGCGVKIFGCGEDGVTLREFMFKDRGAGLLVDDSKREESNNLDGFLGTAGFSRTFSVIRSGDVLRSTPEGTFCCFDGMG